MKKLSALFAALLGILLAVMPVMAQLASGETVDPALSASDSNALAALFDKITSDMTEDDVRALLSDFIEDTAESPQVGTIIGDQYTHPQGFTFRIPQAYRVLSDQLGAMVHLVGPANDNGFTPSIHVMVYDAPRPDFENLTEQRVNAYFGPILANYQFVSLDHYEYLGVSAHEFVCLHGTDDETMMVQYSLCFNKGDKAFILTMTTLAEEAAQKDALEAYDFFLAGFDAPETLEAQDEGNG